jgi:hypothetical protein
VVKQSNRCNTAFSACKPARRALNSRMGRFAQNRLSLLDRKN